MKNSNKLKIAVAMSGGVDSSVAAQLLKNQGHEVAGIFLHFWSEHEASGGNKCCSPEALKDARSVAARIGIKLYVLNFASLFKKEVADNFLSEYAAGRTPNPCVRCNKLVKLGYLIKQAKKLGFDYVASGHYARLQRKFSIFNFQFSNNKKNKCRLFKAKDKNKDQSYFLYTLSQDELKHLLFPLGNLTKSQVRRLASKHELPVAGKKDSQEICFIPGKNHNDFLKRHLALKAGPIKILGDQSGKTIGNHLGLPLYTIGQRKGINIGGTGPYYAAKMDYRTNVLYVVKDLNDQNLFRDQLTAKEVNWLEGALPVSLNCRAVYRYQHQPVDCLIKKSGPRSLSVKFTTAQRAVMAGQSVVFYRGEELLGGGVIKV